MKRGEILTNRPRGSLFAILKRLSGYLLEYKVSVLLVSIGFIFSTFLSLAPAWFVKMALDHYLVPEKIKYLWLIAFAMVGTSMFQGGIDFLNRYLAETRGQKVVYKIRQQAYEHLLKMPFAYFDQSRTGDILSRITADAETLQAYFGFALLYIINNSLFVIGILIVLLRWSLALAFFYILVLPFIVLGISIYAFRVRPALKKARRALGKLTEYVREQIRGIQLIKVFGREKSTIEAFKTINQEYRNINLEAGRISSFWMPYVFVLIGISTGLILWYGGMQVINERITLGTLVGFSTYMGMMVRPIRQTGMLVSQFLSAAAAAERIFEILDTESDIRDEPGAVSVPHIRGAVRYENVSFSYDKKTPVLKNVSFSVNPGETIALVGLTGSGKSTLMHLLPRFYDVDSGQILIDERPIKEFTVESLRKHIGIVLQHTFLFNLTIKENIVFGKPEASLEEVREAAKAAEIDDYIMSLPKGYDTVIGERGMNLSGGQRQRISIARTLLTDPKILILDEPTSNIDSETDEKIQKALERLCKNRTVFIIAHRLWTLKNADRILVIDQGQIKQWGTHEELLEKPGLYREIYQMQVYGNADPEKGEADKNDHA